MAAFTVLFQFIPNSGIFGGFQLLGSPQVSKCTISTFSAEINNQKKQKVAAISDF